MTPARQLLLALILGLVGSWLWLLAADAFHDAFHPKRNGSVGLAIAVHQWTPAYPNLDGARVWGRVYDDMMRDRARAETRMIRGLLGDPWLREE